MKFGTLSTFCLILILSSVGWSQGSSLATQVAPAAKSDRFSAEWRLRLSGTDAHDEQSQAKVVDLRADFKAKYLLSSVLQLDLQPSVRLQSGQTQSIEGADKPENKILLSQAAAHYLPFHFLKLSAGALNQRYSHSEILVDNIAFPAARAEAQTKWASFKANLITETAIPTSTSLSTNTKDLEATPSLNSVAVKTVWMPSNEFSLKSAAGYFAYNNLPSAVAQKSGLLGNEINKLSEAQYSFVNKYQGLEAAIEANIAISSHFKFTLGAEYIKNEKAQDGTNSGQRLFANGEYQLSSNMDLGLTSSVFSIAPETTVAYFANSLFETNRNGYSVESYVDFNKEKFMVGVKYVDSEVMYSNAIQSREKTLFIKLETFYAEL